MTEQNEIYTGMKLIVTASMFDQPTDIDTDESQIRFMLDNPRNFFDRHQTLLRMLGTAKSYKFMTTGKLVNVNDRLVLSYEESIPLGMSGDPVLFYFPADTARRSALVIEKPGKMLRIAMKKDQCVLNLATSDGITVPFTTRAFRIENDITRGGGSLAAEFELMAYGIMLGRARYEIKATPYEEEDPFERFERILHLGRS